MIKYSRQRESIVNFLASRTDHPTAETIYQNIKKNFPTSVLELFTETFPCLRKLVRSSRFRPESVLTITTTIQHLIITLYAEAADA